MINRNEELNQVFGRRLQEERAKRTLSQHQLWLLSGINTAQIGRIERGVANPTLGTALDLARALGVSLDTLIPPASYLGSAMTG